MVSENQAAEGYSEFQFCVGYKGGGAAQTIRQLQIHDPFSQILEARHVLESRVCKAEKTVWHTHIYYVTPSAGLCQLNPKILYFCRKKPHIYLQ